MASTKPITPTDTLDPPISFITLPVEILHFIISYANWREVYNIMRVCKRLYQVAYGHLLEDLAFMSSGEPIEEFHISPARWRLLIYRDRLGSDVAPSLPWNGTRRVAFLGPEAFTSPGLLNMLQTKIKSGVMNLHHIEMDVSGISAYKTSPKGGIFCNFFDALKSYATDKPINKFSFSLKGSSVLFKMQELIQFDNVTSLYYTFDGTGSATSIFSRLGRLLTATPNLRKLSLWTEGISIGEEDIELVISLQTAFDHLYTLTELTLYHNFLKDSIFIVPPPNIIALQLQCDATPLWWSRFSRCKLPKVESLTLSRASSHSYPDYQRENVCHGIIFDQDGNFQIEDLAITTLKNFKGNFDTRGPSNLLELLLDKNPGMSTASIDGVLHQIISPRLSTIVSHINKRLIGYANSVADEYFEMWKAGQRGEELEKEFLKRSFEVLMKEALEGKMKEWDSVPSTASSE
ncbi:hypothetical protein TWF506_008416 [Arthrobotrys conoides]|uniref:F-box domain-containing protein n=1 Tax=Arthrobotrys conoides TaxID=74498 RepID=A0AAN8N997_9PEZI